MNILVLSDTHCKHREIDEFIRNSNVDLLIHAGDGSNTKESIKNEQEVRDVLTWISSFHDIQYKIYVPGNHDTSIERGLVGVEEYKDIKMLIHYSTSVEGINIFGSPYTPSFGHGWAYNINRDKLDKYWKQIPNYTDILITHGPSQSILDLTMGFDKQLIQVGCKALLNRVLEIQPKYHIFGHLHDEKSRYNHGVFSLGSKCETTFINASIVNLKHQVVNKPILFKYKKEK